MTQNQIKMLCVWAAKIALFAVPFVPLVIASSLFFPYITGKAFIFRVLIEVAFALWVALAIFYKEYRPRLNALTVAVAAFVLVVVLATIFSANPYKSFWSNYERMEGLVAYLHLAAYFLVLSHIFEKRDWIIFFNLFVFSGILESFYTIFQKLGYIPSPQGGVRVDGTIGNSTYLAAYLIFVLGFSAILWLHARSKYGKIYYGAASALALVSIYFTATRGAILAIFLAGFLFACAYLFLVKTDTPRGKLHRKIGLIILGALVAIPILFLLVKNADFVSSSPVLSRFRNLSIDDARYYIWQMSWEGFKENPILGWGPESYGLVFAKYFRPELYAQEPWFDRAHNIVFDWLINAGVSGLAAYFGLFAAAGYLLWKNYAGARLSLEVACALSLLLAVYLLQNLFVFDNIATYISFFTILAYIYNLAVFEDPLLLSSDQSKNLHQSRHHHYAPVLPTSYWPLVVGGLALPLVLILYYINFKPLMANAALLNALKVQSFGEVAGGFESFKKALSYNTLGNVEIREQLVRFADAVAGSPALPQEQKLDVFRLALAEAQKSALDNPLDPRPLLFLGVLYNRAQLYDEALDVFKRALALSPAKQQILFELADVHIKGEQYKQALEYLEEAYALEPRFNQAKLNLIATLILAKENERADKLIIESGLSESPEPIFLQAYTRVKDNARMVGLLRHFIREYPGEWEYREKLIRALLALGRRGEAATALSDAITRPEFSERIVGLRRELGL
jgi:putative inorganic carbon (HCO3(-)) transporter